MLVENVGNYLLASFNISPPDFRNLWDELQMLFFMQLSMLCYLVDYHFLLTSSLYYECALIARDQYLGIIWEFQSYIQTANGILEGNVTL